MKDNLRFDRARVQMGKISGFGLLELSRQRRRTGVLEGTRHVCPNTAKARAACVRLEVGGARAAACRSTKPALEAKVPHAWKRAHATDVALYLLNEKREALAILEANRHVALRVTAAAHLIPPDYEIQTLADRGCDEDEEMEAPREQMREPPREQPREQREHSGRRGPRRDTPEPVEDEEIEIEADVEEDEDAEASPETEARRDGGGDDSRRRRRRGRRGGKRRRDEEGGQAEDGEAPVERERPPAAAALSSEDRNSRRRRRRRGRGRRPFEVDGGEWLDFVSGDLKQLSPRPEGRPEGRHQNGKGHVSDVPAEDVDAGEGETAEPQQAVAAEAPAPRRERKPRNRGWRDRPRNVEAEAAEPAEEAELEQTDAREEAPVPAEPAYAAQDREPELVTAAPAMADAEPAPNYEPDQERRDKFFSRLSRWSKK